MIPYDDATADPQPDRETVYHAFDKVKQFFAIL
jgi:hypothetical protein